jgi:hypothetical protein
LRNDDFARPRIKAPMGARSGEMLKHCAASRKSPDGLAKYGQSALAPPSPRSYMQVTFLDIVRR